jgi:hypothetical protein
MLFNLFYLKILQITDNTKPKNIKELNQLIKESNDVQFSFRANDVATATKNEVSADIYSIYNI